MQPFERDSIQFMIGESRIAADVRAQLPYVSVVERMRHPDSHTTTFAVDDAAPSIIPHDVDVSADLDVDAYGTVSACLSISNGRVTSLLFDATEPHWPAHPRILGVVA